MQNEQKLVNPFLAARQEIGKDKKETENKITELKAQLVEHEQKEKKALSQLQKKCNHVFFGLHFCFYTNIALIFSFCGKMIYKSKPNDERIDFLIMHKLSISEYKAIQNVFDFFLSGGDFLEMVRNLAYSFETDNLNNPLLLAAIKGRFVEKNSQYEGISDIYSFFIFDSDVVNIMTERGFYTQDLDPKEAPLAEMQEDFELAKAMHIERNPEMYKE